MLAGRLDRRLIPPLAVAFALGAGLAAYLDWFMWHPMSAIVVTLLLAILGVVGAVMALVRGRRIRPAGLVLASIALGGFAGQALGPSRPATHRTVGGSVELVLTAPTPSRASGSATCGLVAGGGQILVDPDEFGVARPSENADFHYVNISIGDMWDFGDRNARPDHVSVTIRVIQAIVPDDGMPSEVEHTSDRESAITLHDVTPEGGSLSFANLRIETPSGGASDGRSDLAGTVAWTCGTVPTGPEPAEPNPDATPTAA